MKAHTRKGKWGRSGKATNNNVRILQSKPRRKHPYRIKESVLR